MIPDLFAWPRYFLDWFRQPILPPLVITEGERQAITPEAWARLEAIGAIVHDGPELTHPHSLCGDCIYYSRSPYLRCTVHPTGRPADQCPDQATT